MNAEVRAMRYIYIYIYIYISATSSHQGKWSAQHELVSCGDLEVSDHQPNLLKLLHRTYDSFIRELKVIDMTGKCNHRYEIPTAWMSLSLFIDFLSSWRREHAIKLHLYYLYVTFPKHGGMLIQLSAPSTLQFPINFYSHLDWYFDIWINCMRNGCDWKVVTLITYD